MNWGEKFAERLPGLARHIGILGESWRQQNEAEAAAKPRSDHEFLPAALEIMEKPPSPGLRYLMLSLCGLFLIALIWSFIGKVDIVATASGKVIPSGNVKIIQPIEIGYVRAIHVKNGQHVQAGDLLVELDSTIAGADAAQANQGLLMAKVVSARNAELLAHLDGRAARFVAPPGTPAEVIRTQIEFVQSAIAEYEGERSSLIQQRSQQQATLAGAQAELDQLRRMLPLVNEQLEARRELAEKGYFSKIRLLEYEQLKLEHEQNIQVQLARAAEARALIGNSNAQLKRLRGTFAKSAAIEMAESQEKSGLAREEVTKSARRAELQQLRAPVSGIVQQLIISTIGGVVQPAQALMIIVPDQARAVVEANIQNRDIGFIREGQPVRVKLEAFPFTEYGIIPGVVESISRDAIDAAPPSNDQQTNASGERRQSLAPVYATRIRLLKRTVRVGGREQIIGPGLAVQAEIKTGQRRIIQYLVSPLTRTFDQAAHER